MIRHSEAERPTTREEQLAQGELETLRTILVGRERQAIDAIKYHLDDRGALVRDLSDALPQAIRLRHKRDDELSRALAQPLNGSLHRSIRRDPRTFADALFPVIGPAIRRAIAEALRGLVQNINQTLDHSLSMRGLRWRWEALRSGVPFGEVVLRHTLAYRVEQVFLIRPDNGLLIAHVNDELATTRDADAISAMLTAIQSFVKDAFDANEPVDLVEMGEHTVWLVHGPHAYLACAINGVPPRKLNHLLDEVLRDIHAQFGEELIDFDGERAIAESGIKHELQRCLVSETKDDELTRRGLSKPFIALMIAAVTVTGWWAYQHWLTQRIRAERLAAQEAVVKRFEHTPGYVLTRVVNRPQDLELRGLRDPLATPPQTLLSASDLSPDQVKMHWRTYQSAEHALALARANQRLDPPDSVTLELTPNGRLVARGVAEAAWSDRAAMLAPTVPGVESLDTAHLQDTDAALEALAKGRLAPLHDVVVKARSGTLHLSGRASTAWIRDVPRRLGHIPWLKRLETSGLEPTEYLELEKLRSNIDATHVMFAKGSADLSEPARHKLAQLARQMRQVNRLATILGLQTYLKIIGRTDSIGDPEQNARLAAARTQRSADFLRNLGIEAGKLEQQPTPTRRQDGASMPELRRVEFRLSWSSKSEGP